MKDFLIFCEEQGYVVWNETEDQYDFTVDDIYSTQIMDEYKEQTNG